MNRVLSKEARHKRAPVFYSLYTNSQWPNKPTVLEVRVVVALGGHGGNSRGYRASSMMVISDS